MSIDKKRNSNSIFLTTVLAAFSVGACSESTTRMRSGDPNFQWPKARLAAGPVETFVSCDEISEHVRSIVGVRSRGNGNHGRPSAASAARARPAAPMSTSSSSEILGNRQEAGVAETDLIAVGEKQIVVARGNKLTFLRRSDLSKVGELHQKTGQQIAGMYIDAGRLVVVVNQSSVVNGWASQSGSSVSIFELADNAKPSLIIEKHFQQPVSQSRVTHGHLIAMFNVGLTGDEKPEGTQIAGIECGIIAKPQINPNDLSLTKVLSMDVHAPEKPASVIGVFAAGRMIYMNEENLYVTEAIHNDVTGIHKIRFDSSSGTLQLSASGKAPGKLQDAFAMREVTLAGSSYLVLATNSELKPQVDAAMGGWSDRPVIGASFQRPGGRANNLFIIKQDGTKLVETGSITGIAPGEDIKAVRYVDEMAYMVTFRQIDPLFAISMTDPAAPKILGELKVPGFSEYLHPVAEGRLLGVGIEQNMMGGGITEEVKISLFDTSKADELKEVSTLKRQGSSEANQDYKAFMYDPETKIAFVPVDGGAMILDVGSDKVTEIEFITQLGFIRRAFKFDGFLFTVSTDQIVARDLKNPATIIKKSSANFWPVESERAGLN